MILFCQVFIFTVLELIRLKSQQFDLPELQIIFWIFSFLRENWKIILKNKYFNI